MQRDKLFFIFSIIFVCVLTWYSQKGYQEALHQQRTVFGQKEAEAAGLPQGFIDTVNLELLKTDIEFSEFDPMLKRNAFTQYMEKKPAKDIVLKVSLPEKKMDLPQLPVIPQEEPEVFLYRGIVVLGDKISYVIERERDTKTYFVNKGDHNRDFTVLETNAKEVVVSDKNDKITVIPLFKQK